MTTPFKQPRSGNMLFCLVIGSCSNSTVLNLVDLVGGHNGGIQADGSAVATVGDVLTLVQHKGLIAPDMDDEASLRAALGEYMDREPARARRPRRRQGFQGRNHVMLLVVSEDVARSEEGQRLVAVAKTEASKRGAHLVVIVSDASDELLEDVSCLDSLGVDVFPTRPLGVSDNEQAQSYWHLLLNALVDRARGVDDAHTAAAQVPPQMADDILRHMPAQDVTGTMVAAGGGSASLESVGAAKKEIESFMSAEGLTAHECKHKKWSAQDTVCAQCVQHAADAAKAFAVQFNDVVGEQDWNRFMKYN